MYFVYLSNLYSKIFTNSGNSKTPDSPRLLVYLSDKINLKKSDKNACFTKFQHILHMQKYKKVVEKQ